MIVSQINSYSMDIQEVKTLISEFKTIRAKGSITPESLGQLLDEMLDALADNLHVKLDVNVFEGKTKFVKNSNWEKVWNAMQQNIDVAVTVRVNYASGLKVLYYATCVKQNYISLHAKAGSCELHLASDGSFTISGTSLW